MVVVLVLLMQHIFECPKVFENPKLLHLYNKLGKKETIDTLLAGPHSSTWWTALANELGRLTNDVHGRVRATNTIHVILWSDIPSDRQITYANFICEYGPYKSELYRIRLTVGGDRLDCLNNTYPQLHPFWKPNCYSPAQSQMLIWGLAS